MERFCRGCLIRYDEPTDLLEYTEKNRRLFIYCTGIQVKRNDTFTFQLCKDCYVNMKQACKFKKLCRTSDKKFKTYLSLKEIGDAVDLCTYLKNNDDNNSLRFPSFAASSTPRNQKNKDGIDDLDESTCTSIGNFMTDILQGEEMPDTEARIIRQVIEEEADVLDDSLDSHWLQDDVSIDNDFRLDFNFSPFSSPQSVTNGHYYTPSRLFTPNRLYTPSKPDEVQEVQSVQHKYAAVPKMIMDKPKDHVNLAEAELAKKMLDVPNEMNQETNNIIVDKNQLTQKQIGADNETEKFDTSLEKSVLNEPKDLETIINVSIVDKNQVIQKQIDTDLQIDTSLEKSLLNEPNDLESIIKVNIVDKDQITQKQIGIDFETETIDYLESDALLEVPEELNNESNITIAYEDQVTQKQISTDMETEQINISMVKNFVSHKANKELPVEIFGTGEITDVAHQVDPAIKVNSKNYYVDNSLSVEEPNIDKLDVSYLVDNRKEIPEIQQNILVNNQKEPEIEQDVQPVMISDSIDKNLQNALKGDNELITLEDLLASPAVLPSAGVLTTPSIHNLVYGDISDKENCKIILEENICTDKLANKDNPLDVFKDDLNGFESTKLGSVSSIEKIIFGEKIDENSTIIKQYPVGDLYDSKIDGEPKTQLHSIEKMDDSKTENKTNSEGYLEVLDEFFNSRDMKLHTYSENEFQDLIINSGTRYDNKTCEEIYDFEELFCKLCQLKFKGLGSLRIHSAKVHKILLEKGKYQRVCNICGVTTTPCNLPKHMELHEVVEPNKDYKCDICQLSFKLKHLLVKHKLSHKNATDVIKQIEKYKCSDCGSCLSSLSSLKIHQKRKHTFDFVFACTVCGKRFCTKNDLVTHMRNHTEEKPYKCSYCPKAFKQSTILNKHIKSHSDDKPYKCDHCLGSFVHKGSIISHLKDKKCPMLAKKKKKVVEDIDCAFCYLTCSGLNGLLTHQRKSEKCLLKIQKEREKKKTIIEERVQRQMKRKKTMKTNK